MKSWAAIATERLSRPLGYAILGYLWLCIALVCLHKMLPRLDYFHAGIAIRNDGPCAAPECDFSHFWPAGLLARQHLYAQLYDPQIFWSVRLALFKLPVSRIDWIYPPPTLLPAMLVSWLPFELGFLVWSTVQLMLAVLLLRWARLSWPVIIIGLLSPAALWNLELGQLGILTGAILLVAMLRLERLPWAAGAIVGILIFKPQAAVLLPVVFLGAGRFTAFAAAAAATLALLALTTLVCGTGVWLAYLGHGVPAARAILQAPFALGYQQFGVSVFWMMRSFGLGYTASYAAQLVVSVMTIGATWWLWRKKPFPVTTLAALTVCLTLLATPYGFTYDMVAYSVVLTMLTAARSWRIDPADALFWLWPALCPVVVMKTGLLLTPLVVTMVVARVLQRAVRVSAGLAQITP